MSWEHRAACAGLDWATFFPMPESFPGTGEALAVCASCPVRVECLAAALARPQNEDHGVRGGFAGRERRRLRRLLEVK